MCSSYSLTCKSNSCHWSFARTTIYLLDTNLGRLYLCRRTELQTAYSVLLYGYETLTLTNDLESWTEASGGKCLNIIMMYHWYGHVSSQQLLCYLDTLSMQHRLHGNVACIPKVDPAFLIVLQDKTLGGGGQGHICRACGLGKPMHPVLRMGALHEELPRRNPKK